MSNERDELARIIERDDLYNDTGCCDWIVADKAADAILAAGYRKHRTVTTAAELDALPVGSVVLDKDGAANQKDGIGDWFDARGDSSAPSYLMKHFGPVTVLHEATR